jgi:hypothetical protein
MVIGFASFKGHWPAASLAARHSVVISCASFNGHWPSASLASRDMNDYE